MARQAPCLARSQQPVLRVVTLALSEVQRWACHDVEKWVGLLGICGACATLQTWRDVAIHLGFAAFDVAYEDHPSTHDNRKSLDMRTAWTVVPGDP